MLSSRNLSFQLIQLRVTALVAGPLLGDHQLPGAEQEFVPFVLRFRFPLLGHRRQDAVLANRCPLGVQ